MDITLNLASTSEFINDSELYMGGSDHISKLLGSTLIPSVCSPQNGFSKVSCPGCKRNLFSLQQAAAKTDPPSGYLLCPGTGQKQAHGDV